MINSFLVTLVNSATQPVNPSSTTGNVYWPSPVEIRMFSTDEQATRSVLFANTSTNLDIFIAAIQLLWVVEESSCYTYITKDDQRITYSRPQLVGQLTNISDTKLYHINSCLSNFDMIKPLSYLSPELASIYRSSLSKLDRLAAVITHFGIRP
jgi:hypothetical protein